ncbi:MULTISPECIES: ArdC-like ssDNA-binding domain-containing protein [unclassified Eggerthella]|uniref:ArdC-like ssDNA-binding domain-containing protein n=1 Tax=unclassified Eggerthella TaxID=2648737 RepID=UPI00136E05E3|nr:MULTISPECIES: ArdC-like ssDNA-binding domain-containing protein [unclassified Eggerthella]MZJ94725.1 hypothetical protein [Eggerthella sp. BIOML-A3]MZJ98216.1 hypothetical protein [Eggerthella sp. BIOML-A1]MZK34902.1 hypothetical protein [Eggerthella sp. BIOML-A5]
MAKSSWKSADAAAKREEELQQTLQRLEEGVEEIFTSGKYMEYLTVMSHFHNYSFNNCMLIAWQRPDATLVAGYRAWQDKFGRHVKKGERGIRILSPIVVKGKLPEDEQHDTGDPDAEKAEAKRLVGFRLATVFDVSQTEGRDLPSMGVDELQGDVGEFETVMDAIGKISKYPISFEEISGGAKGFFSHADPKRIVIQEGMPQAQTLKTAVHELAHSVMHDFEPEDKSRPLPDRNTREVQAESVAFVVSNWLGLDTSDYSFGYIASWSSGKEISELRASLDDVRLASHGIIDGIEEQILGTRKPGERERGEMERTPGRDARRLTERAGAARTASAENRTAERAVDASR